MFDSIKNTLKGFFKSRLSVLIALFCVLTFIIIQRLFVLQIVNGKDYLENYTLSIRKTVEIPGTRGNIYDRDGELLATNRLAYSVRIEDSGSYKNLKQKNDVLNEIIDNVIGMIELNGDTVDQDFGITLDKNGNYEFLYAKGTRRQRFLADVYGYASIDKLKEEGLENATPKEVMDFLCAGERKNDYGFGVDQKKYGKDRALKIVTVRYGMHLNEFQKYIPTTIASDVNGKTVAMIEENLNDLQGISIGEESLREYIDSEYFAPLLGYTGKISQEEYDALTKKQKEKYSLTDIVGKSGIEQVMDEYLQGIKGEETVYVNNVGKVTETLSRTEPKAGNDVYLTIDKEFQITAYKLIEEKLAAIILQRISPVLDYTRDPNGDEAKIIIPAGDIYYSFIGNEILDTTAFAEENASRTEKNVYNLYVKRQESALDKILSQLKNADAPAYKSLPKEMQAYMNYIAADLLPTTTGILLKDKIDIRDDVYKAWKDDKINLYQYLNHAIAKNWIDSSKLKAYIPSGGGYSDSAELYQGLVNYIGDYLKTDHAFEKLIYRYMVKDGSVSGNMICVLLYDQNVLPYDEQQYNTLLGGYSAYDFIRGKIESLEIKPGMLGVEPSTGSAVMVESSTGRTIVCASYPGYDNNRLANTMDVRYYNQVYANSANPFYNKATQELTAPGSTFKPVSAIAGLTEGVISGSSILSCSGPYKNITPSPTCWIYPGAHGGLNVVGGIANSCNSFFYEVGFRLGLDAKGNYSSALGIEKIRKYAELFGLSGKSGLEIPERTPGISDEDAVRSAIGQGTHIYSTSQMAKYVTGVANKGTVYDLTLIYKVVSKDGTTVKEYEPKVYNKVTGVSDETYRLVHEGMRSMAARDSIFQSLRASGMDIAGKTGTAQQSKTHANHVLFIGFAPYNEPQIALSVRIAHGYSSGYPAEIGRDIIRRYFGFADDAALLRGRAGVIGSGTHAD